MPKNTANEKSKKGLEGLRKWNLWLAGLFAVQGLVILTFSKGSPFAVDTSYTVADPISSDIAGHQVLGRASLHLFDVNMAVLVTVFLLVAAVFHALLGTIYREHYEAGLKKRYNVLRWLGYGLSGGLALAAIGMFAGITNLLALVAIFVLTVLLGLSGMAMEFYNQAKAKPNWLAFGMAALAGVGLAVILGLQAWSMQVYGAGLSGYVYGLYGVLLGAGLLLGANCWMQYKKLNRWADYLFSERMLMLLGVVVKTLLAWLIFAGALRP
jgi:hypothetical protein